MAASDAVLLCRTCGKPRGENIAEGTRCAACGRRQAIVLCLAVAVSTGYWTFNSTQNASAALTAVAVALVATPPALVTAVLLHELAHAGAALVLGQTLTRVLVGEGTSLVRIGGDPQLVFGSVVLGNGLTTVLDLRAAGYRSRMCAMLLFAPLVSAILAMASYVTTAEWPAPARTAALLFAGVNALMAVLTSIPVTTFGGRVWSDLASAIYIARADANQIEEHMLLSAQDRIAILVDAGLHEARDRDWSRRRCRRAVLRPCAQPAGVRASSRRPAGRGARRGAPSSGRRRGRARLADTWLDSWRDESVARTPPTSSRTPAAAPSSSTARR